MSKQANRQEPALALGLRGYLHDATLGRINLDQNRIIKVFSIAAVLFLPPNLVCTLDVTSDYEETRFTFRMPLA